MENKEIVEVYCITPNSELDEYGYKTVRCGESYQAELVTSNYYEIEGYAIHKRHFIRKEETKNTTIPVFVTYHLKMLEDKMFEVSIPMLDVTKQFDDVKAVEKIVSQAFYEKLKSNNNEQS